LACADIYPAVSVGYSNTHFFNGGHLLQTSLSQTNMHCKFLVNISNIFSRLGLIRQIKRLVEN